MNKPEDIVTMMRCVRVECDNNCLDCPANTTMRGGKCVFKDIESRIPTRDDFLTVSFASFVAIYEEFKEDFNCSGYRCTLEHCPIAYNIRNGVYSACLYNDLNTTASIVNRSNGKFKSGNFKYLNDIKSIPDEIKAIRSLICLEKSEHQSMQGSRSN